MIEVPNEEISFNDIISKLEEINPDYSTDEIKEYIEEYLLKLFKDQILEMDVPREISVEELRRMRGKIKIMEKSGRWVKKIDSIIKNFQRNLNYLKIKDIKNSLMKWKNFSEYNYLSAITNGSNLIYIDNTNLEFNGNKNINTRIEYETHQSDYDSIQTTSSKQVSIDSKSYEPLNLEFPIDIGTYTDSLRELEKLDKVEKQKEEVKIPIGPDLLERIKEVKLEPMEKKEPKFISIKDFKKYLDEMDNLKKDNKEISN